MQGDVEKAARYRLRAIEVRKIAEDMNEPATRKTLFQVAEDYEQMARTLVTIGEADVARTSLSKSSISR